MRDHKGRLRCTMAGCTVFLRPVPGQDVFIWTRSSLDLLVVLHAHFVLAHGLWLTMEESRRTLALLEEDLVPFTIIA